MSIGLVGILLGLGVLVWCSFRGWSVLVLAPAAALIAGVVVAAGGIDDPPLRERAATASAFDPAEIRHGHVSVEAPSVLIAALPLIVVIVVNLVASLVAVIVLGTLFGSF